MNDRKKCITCGKRKSLGKFGVRSDTKKLRGTCKRCINERSKVLRELKNQK